MAEAKKTGAASVTLNDLRASVAALSKSAEHHQGLAKEAQAHAVKLDDKLTAMTDECNYQRELAAAFQRQLERAKGYIDRMIEGEEAYDAPKVRTEPLPPPPRGPALNEIPMPERKRADRDQWQQHFSGSDYGYSSGRRY